MTVQTIPFALQNAAHSAAIFRQSASAPWKTPGVLGQYELQVTPQSTPNMSVVVYAGRAKVAGSDIGIPQPGMNFTTQGMYDVLNDAAISVTIAAASAVNPRIDSVFIQVQDTFYGDAADQVIIGVVTGVPAATPVAPAIPDNALLLANVAVAANATSIVAANISDQRPQAKLTPPATTAYYLPRTGDASDNFGSGAMHNLINGVLYGAPAGTYYVFGSVVVLNSQGTSQYLRMQAGGYGPPDTYVSVGDTWEQFALDFILDWPGGDMALIYDVQPNSGTGSVRAAGSYMGVYRIGD